ncbi:MAG: glycoside hydrolase family 43 protein [Bacteroidia bacterium]
MRATLKTVMGIALFLSNGKLYSQRTLNENPVNSMLSQDGQLIMRNPIVRDKFTADPTAIVYNNTVYLYTGHDEAPIGIEKYIMHDWLCFSSNDMVTWKEHPVPLKATDFKWSSGKAYASKMIVYKNKFYFFVSVNHATIKGSAIGVAVSQNPDGPFVDARGSAIITLDMLPDTTNEKANLDPTVLIDDDGQAYIFWGNGKCYFAKLKENLIEVDGPIKMLNLPDFEEGAHIHKRNGWYYLTYGYQMPEKVAYAMSRNINGPWEFKGILNEVAGNCETNRAAILDFKGKSYFFYHNGALKNGGSHRRSVCVDYLYYNNDGSMKPVVMTSTGVQPVN